MTTALPVSLGKEKPMEDLFFTAFQTVLRNSKDQALFVVSTYYADGDWFTRVFQCDLNGDFDRVEDGVEREYLGQGSVEYALQSHLHYIRKYSATL